MKKKKVWRYYCDFCDKGSCSAGHMARHEKACTLNPNRICRMCEAMGEKPLSIPELKEIVQGYVEEIGPIPDDVGEEIFSDWMDAEEAYNKECVEALRAATNGCPACMLAALRQSDADSFRFDFEDEKKRFWNKVNEENAKDSFEAPGCY